MTRPRQPPFLAVPGPCDLRCVWCNHGGSAPVTVGHETGELAARLEALAATDRAAVGFGLHHTEPTTYPDLLWLVRRARDLGFRRITLSTSGMKLADRAYAREVAAAGVTDVILSFAGLAPDRADLLLGIGGATRAKLDALEACLDAGISATAVLMFLRPALQDMPGAVQRLAGLESNAPGTFGFKGCLPDLMPGTTPRQHDLLQPSIGELAWTLARVRADVPDFEFQLHGSPPVTATAAHLEEPPMWEPEDLEQALCEAELRPAGRCVAPADRTSDPAWQAAVVETLASIARRRCGVLGLEIGPITREDRAVRVVLGSDDRLIEAIIEPRSGTERFLLAGEHLAVSYSSASRSSSARVHDVLRVLLGVLERATRER